MCSVLSAEGTLVGALGSYSRGDFNWCFRFSAEVSYIVSRFLDSNVVSNAQGRLRTNNTGLNHTFKNFLHSQQRGTQLASWVLSRGNLNLRPGFSAGGTSICALSFQRRGSLFASWVLSRGDLNLLPGLSADGTSLCVLGSQQTGPQFAVSVLSRENLSQRRGP